LLDYLIDVLRETYAERAAAGRPETITKLPVREKAINARHKLTQKMRAFPDSLFLLHAPLLTEAARRSAIAADLSFPGMLGMPVQVRRTLNVPNETATLKRPSKGLAKDEANL